MRVQLNATAVLALAGVAVAGFVAYRVVRAGGAVADTVGQVITHDLNPASSDNVVNQALLAIGQSISGDPNWTLGGSVYDWTHTDQADPTRFTGLDGVNPVSPDNFINRGVNSIGRAVSNDQSWTLGGWLYDITH